VSALAEVAAAVEPSLRPYAVADLPPGRFEGPRAFSLEAVYEGFLLHYGVSRAFAGMDADMRLLAGDTLYALGLDRLARAGDVEAVAELADLISLCAQAQAEGRPQQAEQLWEESAQRLHPA
jgi:hypothetical protein